MNSRSIYVEYVDQYVYVILLTAHNNPDEVVEGLSAGADDFITKPFNPAELQVRVRAAQRVLALESREVTIFAMAKLAESRDPETGEHLERIQEYCAAITDVLAKEQKPEYQIPPGFRKTIYLASSLHDIGKLGVPDSVLLKPGRLTNREFEIMKTHTIVGANALNASINKYPDVDFLVMARDIAQSHHERFDGTGYPDALAGQNIPLPSRIVALADVYDALISKRVYKNAFRHDVARQIIVEESETHFDPEIVAAFLCCEDRFIEIEQKHADKNMALV